eukprot:scaffold85340_cov69-Phaeocystis_antarctica.AAC.2
MLVPFPEQHQKVALGRPRQDPPPERRVLQGLEGIALELLGQLQNLPVEVLQVVLLSQLRLVEEQLADLRIDAVGTQEQVVADIPAALGRDALRPEVDRGDAVTESRGTRFHRSALSGRLACFGPSRRGTPAVC